MRDAFKNESRTVRKPKTSVERWIAHQHTSIRAGIAEFGKPLLHKCSPDAPALPRGVDRNWAKPIPASGTVTDGYWRDCNMPDDAAGFLRDKGDGKRVICSQRADDELLGLMAVRMREKGTSGDLLNGIFV